MNGRVKALTVLRIANVPLSMDATVMDLFQNVCGSASSWKLAKRQSEEGSLWCSVHKGAIFCGEKLVDSAEFKTALSNLFAVDKNKKFLNIPVIGGEMEGLRMFTACHEQRVPCIVIKGVCDFGEGKAELHAGDQKKTIQRKAAYAAFSLFSHVMASRGRDALPPHYVPRTSTGSTLPSAKVVVDASDPNYEVCRNVLAADHEVKTAEEEREERLKERQEEVKLLSNDAGFKLSFQLADEEFEQAKQQYEKTKQRFEELKQRLSTAVDSSLVDLAKSNLLKAKAELEVWPFPRGCR
jgi:hypothetical protein